MADVSRAAKEAFGKLTDGEKVILQEEAARKNRVLAGDGVPQNSEEAFWAKTLLLDQAKKIFETLGM